LYLANSKSIIIITHIHFTLQTTLAHNKKHVWQSALSKSAHVSSYLLPYTNLFALYVISIILVSIVASMQLVLVIVSALLLLMFGAIIKSYLYKVIA